MPRIPAERHDTGRFLLRPQQTEFLETGCPRRNGTHRRWQSGHERHHTGANAWIRRNPETAASTTAIKARQGARNPPTPENPGEDKGSRCVSGRTQ
jgi:hypothetical protein